MNRLLSIALPKGRLGEHAFGALEKAGYPCPQICKDNRKLIFENEEVGVRYFWVKPCDVAVYVERGASDLGIVGKDVLMEHAPDVYELLDLHMGRCRMCVAGPHDFVFRHERTLRVATKFPNIARAYYEGCGQEIELIELGGSIELAPIVGLSDVIVDIVETGATLRENGLAPLQEIASISARLIANKASYKFSGERIRALTAKLERAVTQA